MGEVPNDGAQRGRWIGEAEADPVLPGFEVEFMDGGLGLRLHKGREAFIETAQVMLGARELGETAF